MGVRGAGPACIYTHAYLHLDICSPIWRQIEDGYSYIQEFSARIFLAASFFSDERSGLNKLFLRPPRAEKGDTDIRLVSVRGSLYDHRTERSLPEIYDEDSDEGRELLLQLYEKNTDGNWHFPKPLLNSAGDRNAPEKFNRHIWVWDISVRIRFERLRLNAFAIAALLDRFTVPGDMLTVSLARNAAATFHAGLPDLIVVPRDQKDEPFAFRNEDIFFYAVDENMFLSEVHPKARRSIGRN